MWSVMGVHGCAAEIRGMENIVRGIGGRALRGAVGEEGEKEKGRQLCGCWARIRRVVGSAARAGEGDGRLEREGECDERHLPR